MRQKMWTLVGISRSSQAGVLLAALLLSAASLAAEAQRYLALGDSFTAGTGALPSEAYDEMAAEIFRQLPLRHVLPAAKR